MFFLYLLVNRVNGKVYVGKTGNLSRRLIEHESRARRGANQHLCSAIRKYGFEAFDVIHIATSRTEEDAYETERVLISQYRSMDRAIGYNLTLGGDGVRHTEASRARISERQKQRTGPKNSFFGRTHSLESRQRMAAARLGATPPMLGRVHSAESRLKISNSKKGWEMGAKQRADVSRCHSGERSSTAKITNAQARELRGKFAAGVSPKQLRAEYGLSKASVWRVIRRETFKEA